MTPKIKVIIPTIAVAIPIAFSVPCENRNVGVK